MSQGFTGIPDGYIKSLKLAPNVGYLLAKSVTPTPGTSGSYGSAETISVPSNARGIIPLSISITWGGSFLTGETVTVRITATFSDNSTQSITKSATATGTQDLNPADLQGLFKDGVYITQLSIDASSDQASTSVTVTVDVYGFSL